MPGAVLSVLHKLTGVTLICANDRRIFFTFSTQTVFLQLTFGCLESKKTGKTWKNRAAGSEQTVLEARPKNVR